MINNNYIKLNILDALASIFALYVSFLLRFDFVIPEQFTSLPIKWIPLFIITQATIFHLLGLYARIWRYTSLFDLYAIIGASLISNGISFTYILISIGSGSYPRSVLLLYFLINSILIIGIRLSVRIYYSHYHEVYLPGTNKNQRKILLLIGAGKTGEKIAREIRSTSRNKYQIAGFVDDDYEKHGALLHGRKVFGSVKDIPNLKVKYDELLITAPSSSGDQIRKIVGVCKKTGKRYRIIPGISEQIDGEVSVEKIRDVSYADLLGREEVKLDMNSIVKMIKGKRILITGAGGSIGFELLKQCLNFHPAELICVDIVEEKIHSINQFSEKINSKTVVKTVLASVNKKNELDKVFMENRPQIVFHAAAFKHVPIQEVHPWNAVTTNIGGTLNIIQLSDKYSVSKFVLVSTDKAVNPVNVMGATKRVGEKIVISFNAQSNTTFMAVRFGNVLGSSGSAIPTFQKQINDGGPITITHPEMTRYFMSIQEASQLILQCGALGRDAEIFLLEMGKPIKIVQMAKDLIKLSGLEPELDIPIVYSGLRPGEKLYEELHLTKEKKVRTEHKRITILKETNPPFPWEILEKTINSLLEASSFLDTETIQRYLKQILPRYKPSNDFDSNSPIEKYKKSSYFIKGEA